MSPPDEALCSALGQVLESMYFCEGDWTGPGFIAPPQVGAAVAFSGTCRGELRIMTTYRLASQLAADFLAVETCEIGAVQAQAILHELANVACGAALGAWMPDGDFNMSLPRTLGPEDLSGEWPHRFAIPGCGEELSVALHVG